LCGKTLANNSIALSKIQRHLETNPKGHKYLEGFFRGFYWFLVKFFKTQLLVPGKAHFQNTNIVVLDQLIAETKTD
jgi:hypothetical protein